MLSLAQHYLFDGFIVTGEGCYLSVGSSPDLMATITEMQISAARYANPLTQQRHRSRAPSDRMLCCDSLQ